VTVQADGSGYYAGGMPTKWGGGGNGSGYGEIELYNWDDNVGLSFGWCGYGQNGILYGQAFACDPNADSGRSEPWPTEESPKKRPTGGDGGKTGRDDGNHGGDGNGDQDPFPHDLSCAKCVNDWFDRHPYAFKIAMAVPPSLSELFAEYDPLYPLKALKTELHHVIPRYLGGARNGELVRLPASYHQLITNAFRKLWSYGQDPPMAEELGEILEDVYSRFPLP
jgi:hypothetical protein